MKTLCGPRRLSVTLAIVCVCCAFVVFRELLLQRPDLFLLFRSAPRPRLFSRAPARARAPAAAAAAAPRAVAPASGGVALAAAEVARVDHLLAALSPLLPNGTVDALAVERMIDVLLHAGALPSEHGPRYAAPPAALARPVRLVQIGANDGVSENDPLWHRINHTAASGATLEAVLVEPVPHLFARLSQSYARWAPAVTTQWGAACGKDAPPGTTLPFIGFKKNASASSYFNQREQAVKAWPESFQQLGSFSKRFLLHVTSASEEELDLVTEVHQVPCVSLRSIMCARGWPHVDILHIDAESFDDQVLYSSEVEATRPLVVRLEAQHIDGPSVEKHLIERGYRVMHMCVGSGEEWREGGCPAGRHLTPPVAHPPPTFVPQEGARRG